MDPELEKKIEKIAEQQRLNTEAVRAEYEANRLVETKRLADCLEDAKAAWKEAFWEENFKSVFSAGARYSVDPTPEALAILARAFYERGY